MENVNLSSLVSNIIAEKNNSHCRLCLKEIDEQFVRFEDSVTLASAEDANLQPLSEIIAQVLGLETEMVEDIPAIDSICIICVDKALESARFILQCQRSTEILNNVLNNLTDTLCAVDTENCTNTEMKLFITVEEHNSKLVLQDEVKKKRPYNQKKKLLECQECDDEFNSFAELKSHNITYHSNLTCEKCLEQFPDEKELNFHVSHKHKYKCSDCAQYRSTETSLKEHYERAHSLYVCKDCGKSYKGLDKLQLHEQSHNSLHQCPQCGKKYRVRDFFIKHMKLCVEGLLDPHPERSSLERAFSCEKCGKSYSTPGGLRVHMRFEHGDAQHHICPHCGKKFTAPSYLKVHMVKHTGEKNFKCTICNHKFVSKEALLYHTRRHTGEKPYSCRLCAERFVNASARAEHVKFKHIGPQLQCDICSRKFVTSLFLRKHIERHHDPRSKLYHIKSNIVKQEL